MVSTRVIEKLVANVTHFSRSVCPVIKHRKSKRDELEYPAEFQEWSLLHRLWNSERFLPRVSPPLGVVDSRILEEWRVYVPETTCYVLRLFVKQRLVLVCRWFWFALHCVSAVKVGNSSYSSLCIGRFLYTSISGFNLSSQFWHAR